MPIETSTTIDGLNEAWPTGNDPKSEGDNHLRMIKAVLKAIFDDSAAGRMIIQKLVELGELSIGQAGVRVLDNGDPTKKRIELVTLATGGAGLEVFSVAGASLGAVEIRDGSIFMRVGDEADFFISRIKTELESTEFQLMDHDGVGGLALQLENPSILDADVSIFMRDHLGATHAKIIMRKDGTVSLRDGVLALQDVNEDDRAAFRFDPVKGPVIEAKDAAGVVQQGLEVGSDALVYRAVGSGAVGHLSLADLAGIVRGAISSWLGAAGDSYTQLETRNAAGVLQGALKIGANLLTFFNGGTGKTSTVWTDESKVDERGTLGVNDFAVGQYLMASCQTTFLANRNSVVTLRQSDGTNPANANQGYMIGGTGTVMTGTWRNRGVVNMSGGGNIMFVQKTAA